MKLKRIAALSLAIMIPLSACSNEPKATESQVPVETTPAVEESVTSIESLDGLEVDQNIFDVSITIPADFLDEGITQEELNEEASEAGYKSATLNEDGSATYIMTKAQHKEMMNGIRESIDQALDKMIDPESYPSFVEITANDDYSHFTVKTTATELGLTESFSVLAFYVYGGMYHAFNGTQIDDIAVTFINAETGDVIEEANSSDTE